MSQKHDWRQKTPSLVFLADQDGFGLATQPRDCIDLFETMNKKERHVDFYLMENSTHVFDSEFYIRRGIVYNKEATDFAKNKIISHRFLLKQKEQEIFLNSIKTYADLATEQTNLFLKKKNLEVLEKRLELTKEQFDIGEVTLTDVSIAEARHLLAQSELIESEKNVNTLSAKFNYIFGVDPNKPDIILDYKQNRFR